MSNTKEIQQKLDDHETLNNRGVAYSENGDYDKAIEDFNTAIKIKPDCCEALHNRGRAYYKKGDYDRAIEDLESGIEKKRQTKAGIAGRPCPYTRIIRLSIVLF